MHFTSQQSCNTRRILWDYLEDHTFDTGIANRLDTRSTTVVTVKTFHNDGVTFAPLNQFKRTSAVNLIGHAISANRFNEAFRDHFLERKHRWQDRPR